MWWWLALALLLIRRRRARVSDTEAPWSTALVLNMDRQPHKWARTRENAMRAGLADVRRVAGVDGLQLPTVEELVRRGTLSRSHRTPSGASAASKGWIGNYLGIRRMMEEMAGHEVGLMMEDDVFFARRFQRRVGDLMQVVPDDWDLVYLGMSTYAYDLYRGALRPYVQLVATLPCGRRVYRFVNLSDPTFLKHGFIGGNFGVMLRGHVARLWLDGATPIEVASDTRLTQIITRRNLATYFVYPPLISYYRYESEIDATVDPEADPSATADVAEYDV